MLASVASFLLLAAASAAAQSTTTLCVAGQCLEGTSNISIGAVVTGPSDSQRQFVLLPGTYAATTDPQDLRTALGSPSSRLTYAPGFAPNASASGAQTISFPLDIELQPGVLSTTASLYRGQTEFHAVPASLEALNSTLGAKAPAAGSIVMPAGVWAAFSTGSGNARIVLWDSVPDLAQLPSGVGSTELTLVGLQSTSCTPACSGNSICTSTGTCVCPGEGFTGSSCESCADGFFGPNCQACPANCDKCDDGASGSGLCLVPTVANAPSVCNCVNGQCDASGACACNEGWEDATTGSKCSVCATGFFLSADGDCAVCDQGCERCQANTGICSQCANGLAQDANDPRRCVIDRAASPLQCSVDTFPNGSECSECSPACASCTGSGAGACLQCKGLTFKLDGLCVAVSATGVCAGSRRVGNNAKGTCDSCPAGCATCEIPSFTQGSQFSSLRCTQCLPGTYLSNGACVEACPAGTFISPTDGSTCVACDSSCGTCAGAAQFCMTCTGNTLAHEGSCIAACPTGTFASNGACLACHGDCASCTGGSFDQCDTCASERPVLVVSGTAKVGRCLETCTKSQFFDATAGQCQACDSSCSSCNGSGPNQCLACSGADSLLKGGTCAPANCERGSTVIPGLGTCLSALVAAPFVDNTPAPAPTTPAPIVPAAGRRLRWWEVLLMVLGCVFIFAAVLICWRRQARKKRAAQTAAFARNIESRGIWRRGIHWLGDKLFHTRTRDRDVDGVVARMRAEELERHKHEMELLEARAKVATKETLRSWPASPPPMSEAPAYSQWDDLSYVSERSRAPSPKSTLRNLEPQRLAHRPSTPSMYSQATGMPRREPEPLLRDIPPMPPHPSENQSRFSSSTNGSALWRSISQREPVLHTQPSHDELQRQPTGGSIDSNSSSESRNPFRR